MEQSQVWILWRKINRGEVLYVSERPGDGGKDWGYTDDLEKAKPMSNYWKSRFINDMSFCMVKWGAARPGVKVS